MTGASNYPPSTPPTPAATPSHPLINFNIRNFQLFFVAGWINSMHRSFSPLPQLLPFMQMTASTDMQMRLKSNFKGPSFDLRLSLNFSQIINENIIHFFVLLFDAEFDYIWGLEHTKKGKVFSLRILRKNFFLLPCLHLFFSYFVRKSKKKKFFKKYFPAVWFTFNPTRNANKPTLN